MSFIEQLQTAFQKHSNNKNAVAMQNYMRNLFPFYGIKTKKRRVLLKEVETNFKKEIQKNIRSTVLELYKLQQREFHHCAIELYEKYLRKKYQNEDIKTIEQLLSTNSWWDTVDFISKQILGNYLQQHPNKIITVISKFSESENLWLNRSTIIFQLGYKHNTNEELLFKQCEFFKESDEFFIQKAIGWALREYGKVNPQSVLNFVNSTKLKPLSRKEATRNII